MVRDGSTGSKIQEIVAAATPGTLVVMTEIAATIEVTEPCVVGTTTGTQHILDSGVTPIGVYVYGQTVDGSYAYVAGMSFAP